MDVTSLVNQVLERLSAEEGQITDWAKVLLALYGDSKMNNDNCGASSSNTSAAANSTGSNSNGTTSGNVKKKSIHSSYVSGEGGQSEQARANTGEAEDNPTPEAEGKQRRSTSSVAFAPSATANGCAETVAIYLGQEALRRLHSIPTNAAQRRPELFADSALGFRFAHAGRSPEDAVAAGVALTHIIGFDGDLLHRGWQPTARHDVTLLVCDMYILI